MNWVSGGRLSVTRVLGDRHPVARLVQVNQRLDPFDVESIYAKRFIGALSGGERRQVLIEEIASQRLAYRYRSETAVRTLLSDRFYDWQEVFAAYPLR